MASYSVFCKRVFALSKEKLQDRCTLLSEPLLIFALYAGVKFESETLIVTADEGDGVAKVACRVSRNMLSSTFLHISKDGTYVFSRCS